MPRRKKKKPPVETSIDFPAPGFDPNELLNLPRGPENFKACLHFAELGFVPHQNRIASYYEDGEFVERNLTEAVKWYKKSADKGNPHALRKMGDFYRDGTGIEKDPERAFNQYHLAAGTGWPPALFQLGQCYERGIGCSVDFEKAMECYRKAAEANNKSAVARLEEIQDEDFDEGGEADGQDGDDEYAFPGFVGQCCVYGTVGKFLEWSENGWLSQMRHNHHQVTDHGLDAAQIDAWKDCHNALRPALEKLCGIDSRYRSIGIVFEYVMPYRRPPFDDLDSDPGRRADVVLVSTETVICLEFKRYKENNLWPGAIRQARMYPRKLRRYHVESVGKTKKGILVLTRDRKVNLALPRLRICSPDCLASAIHECFQSRPSPISDLDAWLASEWKELK